MKHFEKKNTQSTVQYGMFYTRECRLILHWMDKSTRHFENALGISNLSLVYFFSST